jgi:hypothetical protein
MKKMLAAILILAFALPLTAFAEPKLVWDPSTGEVNGYRIYYGLSTGSYTSNRDVGRVTEFPLANLPLQEKRTYYFTAKAYNAAGESAGSNEVSWTAPDKTPPAVPAGVTVE